MPTQEISRNDWVEFFHGFSRAHHGWLVTIEVFDSDFGAQVEAKDLTFEGISADLHNSGDSIALNVGGSPDRHLSHLVAAPTHVRLDQTEEGAKEALQIESADQTTTLLRFQSPALADLVSGVIVE